MASIHLPGAALAALLFSFAAPIPAMGTPSPGLAPGEHERSVDFERAKEKARTTHEEGLEEFIGWAQENKAYRLRDAAYESLLEYQPDHKKARKFLKYTYDRKKEQWVRRRPYKAPKAGKPEVVAEGEKKRAALDEALVSSILEAIDEHEDALGPTRRRSELKELLALAPDDEDLRYQLGYIEVEKDGETVWVSAIVAAAEDARERIQEGLAEYRDEMPEPTSTEIDGEETEWGVEWESGLENERVRVVASDVVDEEELARTLETAHVLWDVLPDLIGGSLKPYRGFTIYAFDGSAHLESFLRSYPDLSEDDKALYRRLGGSFMDAKPRLMSWAPRAENRIDFTARSITGSYIATGFGVNANTGWLFEGVGQYVNQLVVGTRLTSAVVGTEYEDAKDVDIERDGTREAGDWIGAAGDILEDAGPIRLAKAMGLSTNEMKADDLFLSYALVSYLIEGHGADTVERIFKGVAEGEASSVQIVEQVLGMKVPDLQNELATWIESVGGHDY